MGEHSAFVEAVMAHFVGDAERTALADVEAYFDQANPFTGSMFEAFADYDEPDRITEKDLVAVSMLGVTIPAEVAVWLASPTGRADVRALLRQVPNDCDLWDHPELVDRDSALWELWTMLSTACWPSPSLANGMGMTKLSKLLAAKRPRLVPITDSVVVRKLPTVDSYWHAFRDLVSDSDRRHLIRSATDAAPPRISLLRRVDVVVWMAHRLNPDDAGDGREQAEPMLALPDCDQANARVAIERFRASGPNTDTMADALLEAVESKSIAEHVFVRHSKWCHTGGSWKKGMQPARHVATVMYGFVPDRLVDEYMREYEYTRQRLDNYRVRLKQAD